MKVTALSIPGVLLIEPDVYRDKRGYFVETFQHVRYASNGIRATFVQDNLSRSVRGVLRGLHIQHPMAQAKLVSVPFGAVFDVAVDLRVGSPAFGRWLGRELNDENQHQLFVPEGCAHGFCVLSEEALFSYKCSEVYAPEMQFGVAHDDPQIGIEWPLASPTLSAKDRELPRLDAIDPSRLPRFNSNEGE